MAAADERSPWLDAILKLERTIGSQVEGVLRSDAYFEFVAQATRARKRISGAVEGFQEEWLHLFNVPAATDVRRLREQVSRMERELEALANELGEGIRPDGAAAQETVKAKPKPRPRRPRQDDRPSGD